MGYRTLAPLALLLSLGVGASAQSVRPVRPGTSPAAPPTPAAPAAPAVPIPDDIERFRVPVDDQPVRGSASALVTIVEFSEFQCPFCARVRPTIERIFREYGEDRVRLVWRNNPLPFHQNAEPAAQLAMEVFRRRGNDAFWRIHDTLFENQRALDRASLERYGRAAGLGAAAVARALDRQPHTAIIDADQALARRIGARGTPNFFINGRQLTGAQPFERFREIIDQELAVADRLTRSGVPVGAVYAALTANGREEAPARAPTPSRRPQPDPSAVYRVPIEGNPPQLGPDDALVTIVEMSDFECPFCSRVQPTLRQVRQRFGNEVRFVFMNNPLPFHQSAFPAAMAALEVQRQGGDTAFWRYHDTLFENQRQLTDANLVRWAREQGHEGAEVQRAITDARHRATVERQQALARGLGASGTPSFFINGRNLRGAQPFERFEELISEELAKARRLVREGTPRGALYERVIRDGATTPQTIAGGAAAPSPAPPEAQRYTIAVPRRAPRRGAARPQLVIQEFSDFECPFCNRVRPTVERILETYGDRVQLVWRDYPLPFHQRAMPAAEAAREVYRQGGDQAFWRFHDLLFDNQRTLDEDSLVRLAGQVRGIDANAVRRALRRQTHRAGVEADMSAVRNAGARIGTPSFLIGDLLIQGAQPFEAFRAAIDAELQRAAP
ncbi:MAG: thioredoxin domain-containing protein [Myxococcota bacterium]